MLSKYKPFLATAVAKDCEGKEAFAKWEAGWRRAGLTEFEASVCETFHNAASSQKKKSTTVVAAHKRLVEFWGSDPSKAAPVLWEATQEAITFVEAKKGEKKSKDNK